MNIKKRNLIIKIIYLLIMLIILTSIHYNWKTNPETSIFYTYILTAVTFPYYLLALLTEGHFYRNLNGSRQTIEFSIQIFSIGLSNIQNFVLIPHLCKIFLSKSNAN